ncbi:sugar ABC transporter permease [Paenibacillus sp. J5C_2022]|uniref:carbohydrate ABC transporter permease n=1 Tax=Paenibacillus sp. J5C2022 TaxID=2977129 RepID=UPI0021CF7F85|nr:sugar ABC transporter permease [Paenibacillus sp. J5C2022]MCU6711143.1 sugar ABC transporter permease [Paenibacillus sp. J5C2022]
MRIARLTLSRRKAWMGVLFILPWFIGFLFLFAIPLLQSFQFSMSDMKLEEKGMSLMYVGWKNYLEAFTVHPSFNRVLTESVTNMLVNVPLLIFFSLFIAVILNNRFRGRALARMVFFLPVIVSTGVISSLDWADVMGQAIGRSMSEGDGSTSGLSLFALKGFLHDLGLGRSFVNYLTDAVSRIYEIISASGVQILIFLAGLQSIPPSLFEASRIEGATSYENFWKITFPLMSPLILTNTIYTIIDSFLNGPMSRLLKETSFKLYEFGLSAAMSWIYFVVIMLLLGLFTLLISRRVFYHDA